MPQFDISTYISQIFWLSICLSFLLIVSLNVTLPKIRDKLDKREKLIEGNRQEALDLQKQASKIQQSFETYLNEIKQKALQAYREAKDDIEIDLSRQKKDIKAQFKKDLEEYHQDIQKKYLLTLDKIDPHLIELASKILYQFPSLILSNPTERKKILKQSLLTIRSKGNFNL